MKIQSQFKGEFLDGRKSFIFSWNKNHREIHEEALWHYFDPQKEGQKFEYQPKQVVKAAYPSSERAPLPKYQSMDEQRGREGIGSRNSFSAKKRHGKFPFGRSPSADETSNTTGMATLDSDHGGKSKETPSVSADRTRIRGKGLRGNLVHWYRLIKRVGEWSFKNSGSRKMSVEFYGSRSLVFSADQRALLGWFGG